MTRSNKSYPRFEPPAALPGPERLRRTDAALAMYTCRACDRPINLASEVCPFCGADLMDEREAASRPGEQTPKKHALLKALAAAGLIAAGLWALVWFVMPHPPANSLGAGEASAVRSLSEVGRALAAYAQVEHSYPASLEQLGNRAAVPVKQAEAHGYRIVYTPGPFASEGNIHSYKLLARPRFYGYRNFYLDQTGVTRATAENRPATAEDQPF